MSESNYLISASGFDGFTITITSEDPNSKMPQVREPEDKYTINIYDDTHDDTQNATETFPNITLAELQEIIAHSEEETSQHPIERRSRNKAAHLKIAAQLIEGCPTSEQLKDVEKLFRPKSWWGNFKSIWDYIWSGN